MSKSVESSPEKDSDLDREAAEYAARLFLEMEDLPPEQRESHATALNELLCRHPSERFIPRVYSILAQRYWELQTDSGAEEVPAADDASQTTVLFHNPMGAELSEDEVAEIERLSTEVCAIERRRSSNRLGAMSRQELSDWLVKVVGLSRVGGTKHDRFCGGKSIRPVGITRQAKSYGRGYRLGLLRQAGISPDDVSAV